MFFSWCVLDWVETGRSSFSCSRRRKETSSDSSGTAGPVQLRAGAGEACEYHGGGGLGDMDDD